MAERFLLFQPLFSAFTLQILPGAADAFVLLLCYANVSATGFGFYRAAAPSENRRTPDAECRFPHGALSVPRRRSGEFSASRSALPAGSL